MRVGLVCPYDLGRPGGVQDQVIRLSRWLGDAGHTVVTIAPGDASEADFVSVGPATVIRANGAATPVALSPRVTRRVVEALDGLDVVHVHEPLMPQVSLAVLRNASNRDIVRQSRQPLVGTFHADVSKVAGLAYTLGRPVTRRWIESLDVITAVSPIAARVVDFTHRVRVIPNGIDVDEYAPGAKDPESAVFLGRDDPRKGLAVLLDAWPQVRLHHPAATLTVVGADQRSEPVPGVVFAGRVTESEKRRLLATAAVFCAPNLSGESFGIVVAEGMAAGCAVVASGLPAFARVVGDAGVLVAPGDGEGLAAAITTLLDDPESIATLGAAAREQVRRFDGPVVAAQYVGAYEDAIDLSRTS